MNHSCINCANSNAESFVSLELEKRKIEKQKADAVAEQKVRDELVRFETEYQKLLLPNINWAKYSVAHNRRKKIN